VIQMMHLDVPGTAAMVEGAARRQGISMAPSYGALLKKEQLLLLTRAPDSYQEPQGPRAPTRNRQVGSVIGGTQILDLSINIPRKRALSMNISRGAEKKITEKRLYPYIAEFLTLTRKI
jgi:hypothetical protein